MSIWNLLALFAGCLMTVQAAVNGQLRAALGSGQMATLVSITISTVLIGAYCLISKVALPEFTAVTAPWWVWTGGIVGVIYVFLALTLTAHLSANTLVSLLICGQICCSLALDHFGLLGFAVHPVNWGRIAGGALLVGAVLLIQRS